MRMFCIAAFIALLGLTVSPIARAQDQLCGDRARIQSILGDCREALAEMKGMNEANPNFKARKRNARQIRRIRHQLRLLRAELAMQPETEAVAEPSGPMAMEASAFSSLLKAVQAESFGKGKLSRIHEAAAGNFFTVAQLRSLLAKFSFEKEKVDAAAALHPRLVDPGNFFQVYQDFTFESNKKLLRKKIGK